GAGAGSERLEPSEPEAEAEPVSAPPHSDRGPDGVGGHGRAGLRLYRRLFREARPYRRHIGGLFALSLLSSVFALLTPLPLKIAVDSVVGSHPLPGFIAVFVPGSVR